MRLGLLAHILVKAGRLTRPRASAACVQGVTFTEVQKPTAATAGDASSAVSGACTAPRLVNNQGEAWVGTYAPRSTACMPARPRARRNTHPALRRYACARDADAALVLRTAGAITLVFLVIGSLESFRLVNDRAEKGLDTYLNKKSR